MYELDKLGRAGRLPGCAGAHALYADGIHLTDLGNYAARCTFYAVLFGETPVGLPGSAHSQAVSDEVARLVQETVWRVVRSNKLTGVGEGTVPAEPRPGPASP